jgi:putative tryptophan/tyrosine transport system substrate-binding protein
MRRRELLSFVASAALLKRDPAIAQPRLRRVAEFTGLAESDPEKQSRFTAVSARLRELGWMPGHNLEFIRRFGSGDAGLMSRYAAELIALEPDVILTSSAQALRTIQNLTRSIPIVFSNVSPRLFEEGFAESLSRPGRNITGFTSFVTPETGAKWLEIIREIAPHVSRATVLYDAENPWPEMLNKVQAGAHSTGMALQSAGVREYPEIHSAFERMDAGTGLLVFPSPFTAVNRETIVREAAERGMPAVYPFRYFTAVGGLASYGTEITDLYRRAANYVDRILKGEPVSQLPIQNPTKFELVINLRTAKALNLTIPPTLLARADEVIE